MTPTDPEVRRAQEWIAAELKRRGLPRYSDIRANAVELASWLAAYSAHENQAAESKLSTLREGLRKLAYSMRHTAAFTSDRCMKDCAKCEVERLYAPTKV